MKPRNARNISDRNIEITKRILNGETYKAVSSDFGFCVERCRQIVSKVLRFTNPRLVEETAKNSNTINTKLLRINKEGFLRHLP